MADLAAYLIDGAGGLYAGALDTARGGYVVRIDPQPGAADTTPPTVTVVTPAGALASASTPVVVEISDAAPGLLAVIVVLRYAPPEDGRTLLVYDGANFVAPFATNSLKQVIGGGIGGAVTRLTILPDGGWPAGIDWLWAYAIDGDGNLEGALP